MGSNKFFQVYDDNNNKDDDEEYILQDSVFEFPGFFFIQEIENEERYDGQQQGVGYLGDYDHVQGFQGKDTDYGAKEDNR